MNALYLWYLLPKEFGRILVVKSGNSVAFLMEHEHFTYPEAIRYLARKYNIEIEETEVRRRKSK
jgi:hypothetical protein